MTSIYEKSEAQRVQEICRLLPCGLCSLLVSSLQLLRLGVGCHGQGSCVWHSLLPTHPLGVGGSRSLELPLPELHVVPTKEEGFVFSVGEARTPRVPAEACTSLWGCWWQPGPLHSSKSLTQGVGCPWCLAGTSLSFALPFL